MIELKKRILTAVILAIVVIPFILLGNIYFKIGISLIGIMGLKEIWDLKKDHHEYPILIKILSVALFLFIIFSDYFIDKNETLVSLIFLLPIIILLLPTIFYGDKYPAKDAIYLLGYIILLSVGFKCFVIVRDKDIWLFIYLISICMFNDIFALFSGMLIGKHKLIPQVSPNKTVEGAIGGLLIGTIASSLIYHFLVGNINIKIVIISIILGITGQLGDLFFSKIKRENDIKDFSNLMPGHGGILDRFDSLIWVMLVYMIFNILQLI